MLKTHVLIEVTKVQPDIWILKGRNGVGFGVIGSVAALVREGLISCDAGQPVFTDKYVYTFLDSARTSYVFPSFIAALKECCCDLRVNPSEGLARLVLGGGSVGD